MRGSKQALILFCFTSLLLGCNGKLTEREYLEWVRDEENGLHAKKESGEISLDVQFQPTQYILLQRKKNAEIEQKEEHQVDGLQYYLLTLGIVGGGADFINHGISNIEEKQRKEYYYSFNFQDALRLEDPSGNTLPCILYHFEKPINLAQSRTFVLGFPASESLETTFIIDSEHLSSLPIKIKINKRDHPKSNTL